MLKYGFLVIAVLATTFLSEIKALHTNSLLATTDAAQLNAPPAFAQFSLGSPSFNTRLFPNSIDETSKLILQPPIQYATGNRIDKYVTHFTQPLVNNFNSPATPAENQYISDINSGIVNIQNSVYGFPQPVQFQGLINYDSVPASRAQQVTSIFPAPELKSTPELSYQLSFGSSAPEKQIIANKKLAQLTAHTVPDSSSQIQSSGNVPQHAAIRRPTVDSFTHNSLLHGSFSAQQAEEFPVPGSSYGPPFTAVHTQSENVIKSSYPPSSQILNTPLIYPVRFLYFNPIQPILPARTILTSAAAPILGTPLFSVPTSTVAAIQPIHNNQQAKVAEKLRDAEESDRSVEQISNSTPIGYSYPPPNGSKLEI